VSALLNTIRPYAKALIGGVLSAVVPLLLVGFTEGWNWKAILAAGVTGATTALGVYGTPNQARKGSMKAAVEKAAR
jgi:hypothetical protein